MERNEALLYSTNLALRPKTYFMKFFFINLFNKYHNNLFIYKMKKNYNNVLNVLLQY